MRAPSSSSLRHPVTRYIVQRLLLLPFLLLVYSFVIFAIIHAPPGDFLTVVRRDTVGDRHLDHADQIKALRHEYGLDQPFIIQYLYWVRDMLHGDFGLSLEYQRPNADLIREQLGMTMALAAHVVRAHLADRGAGGDLFGDASALGDRPRVHRDQLRRRGHAELHAGADPDVDRVRLFRHQYHRPVLPEYVDAPWSIARLVDLLEHIWLPASCWASPAPRG
jgi:peptide/nickel transport system permease protein